MAKKEQETRYNITVLGANGETTERKNVVESAFEKLVKENGADAVQKDRVKSFIITEADSLDEAATLFPQRALEFLNYGARLAQHNYKQDLMEDPDWAEAEAEGAFDLLPGIQEPKERKKASPQDKATSAIMRLAKDNGIEVTREQVLEQLTKLFGVQAQSQPATPTAA